MPSYPCSNKPSRWSRRTLKSESCCARCSSFRLSTELSSTSWSKAIYSVLLRIRVNFMVPKRNIRDPRPWEAGGFSAQEVERGDTDIKEQWVHCSEGRVVLFISTLAFPSCHHPLHKMAKSLPSPGQWSNWSSMAGVCGGGARGVRLD